MEVEEEKTAYSPLLTVLHAVHQTSPTTNSLITNRIKVNGNIASSIWLMK